MNKPLLILLVCAVGGYPPATPISTTTKETTNAIRTIESHATQTPPTAPPTPLTPSGKLSFRWMATLQAPKPSYWDKVAECETGGDWQDRGHHAGGLGIALSTWQAYGGNVFAPKQWQATRLEQMAVANRIALWGYIHPSGRKVYPAGFNGWGCIVTNEYLQPPVKTVREALKASLRGSK